MTLVTLGNLIINNTDTGVYENITINFISKQLTLTILNYSLPQETLENERPHTGRRPGDNLGFSITI